MKNKKKKFRPVNPKRRQQALKSLGEIFESPNMGLIIHYSCESFYEKPTQSSRITSIAIMKLNDSQTRSFSLLQQAEINSKEVSEDNLDDLEKSMLDGFFSFIKTKDEHTFIHWNMRDENFGFQALEHRYKVLGGEPYVIADDHKLDMSSLLIDLFGVGYIGHPRLHTLMKKNHITSRHFLTGDQEAKAFEDKDFKNLHLSTLQKVSVLQNILNRTNDGQLEVNTSWWELHGGSIHTFLMYIKNHWLFVLIGALCASGTAIAEIAGVIDIFNGTDATITQEIKALHEKKEAL